MLTRAITVICVLSGLFSCLVPGAASATGTPERETAPVAAEVTADQPDMPADRDMLFTRFDGAWELGLNTEFIEQGGIQSDSIIDSLSQDKYGLHVGKEFVRTDHWLLGGQLHIVRTNDLVVDDADEIAFDATSLYATARLESLPALQFKLGVTRADYENFFDDETATGLAYGIGLTSGNDDLRIHWLDYEVHRIDGETFDTVSVNLLIVLCLVGIVFGGNCF